jgi:transcriptional antiterminator RfaH
LLRSPTEGQECLGDRGVSGQSGGEIVVEAGRVGHEPGGSASLGLLVWYVARTKARQEQQVSAVLGQRSIESYLPTIRPRASVSRLAQPEPLFPCYLFVRLDPQAGWRSTRSAPGVQYLLGAQDDPTPLSDELIEGIRLRVAEDEAERRHPLFQRGEKVVIARGPLAGLEAVFYRHLSASGRSEVLVEFASRLVPAKVAAADLRRVGEA